MMSLLVLKYGHGMAAADRLRETLADTGFVGKRSNGSRPVGTARYTMRLYREDSRETQ